jgi:hypothetical protein
VNLTVYLGSYDLYVEILEYRLPEGKYTVISRDAFVLLGVPLAFGWFAREDQHVAGVFASPDGPVFFMDDRYLVGRYGGTSAAVETAAGRSRMRFTLHHEGRLEFVVDYQERLGIGANPYDNEPEDVDLFALMATGTKNERFFRAYTRDWVTASRDASP